MADMLTLCEVNIPSMIEVAVWDGNTAPIVTAIDGILGLPVSTERHSVSVGGGHSALWLGPGRWLILSDEATLSSLKQALTDKAAVVDQSHSRTVFEIGGPAVCDLLSKGCSLDFHDGVFPTGHVKSTYFAHLTVLVERHRQDAFRLYFPRGFAVSGMEWLKDAAKEFGLTVE